MTEQDPTLQDLWRLLGSMNKRFSERFDLLERRIMDLRVAVKGDVASLGERLNLLEASVTTRIGALKESIEARDFRLDDHGRRLTKLEESLP
jgi:hypothetical protein